MSKDRTLAYAGALSGHHMNNGVKRRICILEDRAGMAFRA